MSPKNAANKVSASMHSWAGKLKFTEKLREIPPRYTVLFYLFVLFLRAIANLLFNCLAEKRKKWIFFFTSTVYAWKVIH